MFCNYSRLFGRRELFAMLVAGALAARKGFGAQLPVLLYANVDHVSLQVSNIGKSLDFYSRIFGGITRKENASPRYYVKLGSGYIAMAQLTPGRASPRIDHFCAGVRGIQIAETKQYLSRIGIAYTEPPPFGLFFSDPDGIRVQLWTEDSWTDVSRTTAPLPAPGVEDPIFRPMGIDQLILAVSDPEKSASYYENLFGPVTQRGTNPARIWFQAGQSRVGLTELASGQRPGVDSFRVAVAPFENGSVQKKIEALGASLEPLTPGGIVAFRDADGIRVEVIADGSSNSQ